MTLPETSLAAQFIDPPREFGIMPFWFWNDDLTEAELLRQIRAFYDHGFGGFIPHARIGLSPHIGYLSDEFMRLARLATDEAARLGMKVVLYDEGSYPSGSAQGRVTAENPDFSARCLFPRMHTLVGPARGFWRPNPGRALNDRLLCVILGREIAPDTLDPASLTTLEIVEPELARYEVPAGRWRLIACWEGFSGGTIRGVFPAEEDGHAQAPPAGDIMNPAAVAAFLRHTHERYAETLADHFGETVVAMFTDEPDPTGRGGRERSRVPYTPGFLDDLQAGWDDDVRRWLPALWLHCGPRTAAFRHHYERTVYERLERVFYRAQEDWCREHGLALTGHPATSNEIGALRRFHWPGQDMVWRYVEPNKPSALEGDHSTAAKCAASAAFLQGARRNASEALGAYGWRLTLDETKWLLDWHMVRGNNLFFLHACFYSIRGRRAFESEPDIGLHNVWWPYFQPLADYLRRVCWLLSDGEEICQVAILTDPNNVAWRAAKTLYQNQIDFIYIDGERLAEAELRGDSLLIAGQPFRAIVCDPPEVIDEAAEEKLESLAGAGGIVLSDWKPETLAGQLAAQLTSDLEWPNTPDLRVLHYYKAGRHFYYLVNEGEDAIEGELSLAVVGALERWDPLAADIRPWPGTVRRRRLHTHLRLERRGGLILAVDPAGEPDPTAETPPQPGDVVREIAGSWGVFDANGVELELPCPGDWAHRPGWELFAGTLHFTTHFELSAAHAEQVAFLDLGRVGEIAEVELNRQSLGVRAWGPYTFPVRAALRAGKNTLTVWVTNCQANAYDGLQLPSGLLGPVSLRARKQSVEATFKESP